MEQGDKPADISVAVEPPVPVKKAARLSLTQAFKLESLSEGIIHTIKCYENKFKNGASEGELYNVYCLILISYSTTGKKVPKYFTYSNLCEHYKKESTQA